MQRMMKYTAVVLATLTVLAVLWQFKLVLLLFVLSLFVAAAIRPLVDGFVRRGISKGTAQILLYIMALGTFLVALLLGGQLLLQETNLAVNQVVFAYEGLHRSWQEEEGWQQTAVGLLPPPLAAAQDADLQEMAPVIMNITRGVGGAIGGLLLVLVLSVYWSVDQHRFERLWLSLLRAKWRIYARDSWRGVEAIVGKYLRSQTVQSLLVFLFLSVGARVIGFDYPLLLACMGALMAFVPLFGGLFTAVFAVALGGLETAAVGIGTAVYALAIFIGLELIVEPRLWPRKRRSFLLTILVMLPLFELFGLWGLIVAPLLAAAIEALSGEAYRAVVDRRETAVQLDELESRYQQLAAKVNLDSQNGTVAPELNNLSQRLATLLADSRRMEEARKL